jgi:hypothetical protein
LKTTATKPLLTTPPVDHPRPLTLLHPAALSPVVFPLLLLLPPLL